MINICQGLVNSLIILEILRNDERLDKVDVYVRCFQNLREMGLTFTTNGMTYCIYEHRNSDAIIINGKKGWSGGVGDLPYMSDSKWENIKSFSYNEHLKCAECLIKLLLKNDTK